MDGNTLIIFTLFQMMWVSNICRVFRHSNWRIYSRCDQNLNSTIDLSLWKLRCRDWFSKMTCSKYHKKQLSLHIVWNFFCPFFFLLGDEKMILDHFYFMNLLIVLYYYFFINCSFDNTPWPRARKRRKRYMKTLFEHLGNICVAIWMTFWSPQAKW